MKSSLVSIIIITYNRAALLKESIESVLKQTYPHFELLVVDDGSIDETEEVVKRLNDGRIRYFKFDHSAHTGKLKNFAIQQAKGEFIAFNDSDDNWKEDKLEKQMKLLTDQPEIGFSITDVVTFRGDEILIEHTYQSSKNFECRNIFDLMKESRFLVYPFTLVIRRECFEKTGWFSESMVSGDYHFIMRLAYHFDTGILYEPLVWRRMHDSNMSKRYAFENYDEFIATFELLYRNKWVDKRHLKAAKSIAFFKMARLLEKKGELPGARRQYLSSIRQRWFHLDSYVGLIKTFIRSPSRPVNN